METIEVRGVEYKLVKARDFEVIVRSDNGFINYTKLCQQINDGKKPFYNIKQSETFQNLCIQMEFNSQGIPCELPEVSLYEQIKDRIEITETGSSKSEDRNRVAGTYMPRYLLDYVIMTCDISYYKLIHELMDSIDQVAQERQVKFIEELQSNISEQNRKLERKRAKITRLDQLCNELRESNTNLANQMTEVREQNNQLLERTTGLETQLTHANQQLNTVNQQLDVANTKITRIGEHMTKFTDFIGDSLGEFNLTTSSAKYVYLVIDRPSLVNEARENHTIGTNQYLFDSICCLKINRAKELRAHNYDEHNDHIIIEYECSCSLDISKWIKRHFTDANCSVINTGNYIRKIRFVTSIRQEVIDSINRFLYRSQATKQTILEHIENMEDILEVQNSQIQELREQINQIRTLLNEHRPNAVSVYSNGRYRELITQPDGSIVYIPRARSSEIELTEEDIRNLKFKDVNGRFVNYRE